MITIIEGHDAKDHAQLLDAMFRQRARVLGSLGWPLAITDGRERDGLDDCGPVYVIASDLSGYGYAGITGSLRLLPTTGPTLLEKAFPQTAPAHISSPEIWEMSRLCIEPAPTKRGIHTLLELFDATGQIAKRGGITSIIGNISADHIGLYRHIGIQVDVMGQHDDVLLISIPIEPAIEVVIMARNERRGAA